MSAVTEPTAQEPNPWLAPDPSLDWPAPHVEATPVTQPPAAVTDPLKDPVKDPVDDMWWPVDDSKPGARRMQSNKSWAIAGIAAIALTLLSIVGINAASSNTTVASGPGGGFNGRGFPGGGNFPPNGGFGGNGQPGNRTAQNGNFPAPPGQNGATGFPGGSGTAGSITAVSATGFTLAESGGQTTNVTTNASTQVVKIGVNAQGAQGGSPATLVDLKVGEQVSVVGDTANGTMTAAIVLITSS